MNKWDRLKNWIDIGINTKYPNLSELDKVSNMIYVKVLETIKDKMKEFENE